MLVLEAKLRGEKGQYVALDEALRTARFVRNMCLRYWMDNRGLNKYDLNKYCAVLAKEFEFAKLLNSTARQASAERALAAIAFWRLPPEKLASGHQSLGFLTTVEKENPERKDIPNSENIRQICQLNIKHRAGNYRMTDKPSRSQMDLRQVLLECGVLVISTSIK